MIVLGWWDVMVLGWWGMRVKMGVSRDGFVEIVVRMCIVKAVGVVGWGLLVGL